VRSHSPGQVVVNEETRGAAPLDPGIIQTSQSRERRVRSAALEHNRKCRQRFFKIGRTEEALIPGEGRVKVIDQVLGENMRVAGGKRVERLWGDRVKQRVDRVCVCGLQTAVLLESEPGSVLFVDVV